MEQDWGSGEQGAVEKLEQGANNCPVQDSELPPNPKVREQEVPRKELKQAPITRFLPEAPPETPPPHYQSSRVMKEGQDIISIIY